MLDSTTPLTASEADVVFEIETTFLFHSNAGDVDGDGYDDLLIGAPLKDGSFGESYLFLSSSYTTEMTMADADVTFTNSEEGYYSGFPAVGIGDVDGDGGG